MSIDKSPDIKKNQFCSMRVSVTIILLIFLFWFSHSAYSSCVNETGLSPLQIKIAANNKQIQILKDITSKKSSKKAIPKLKECLKQKRKLEAIFNGDIRI